MKVRISSDGIVLDSWRNGTTQLEKKTIILSSDKQSPLFLRAILKMLSKCQNKLKAAGYLKTLENFEKKQFQDIIFQQDYDPVHKWTVTGSFFPREREKGNRITSL